MKTICHYIKEIRFRPASRPAIRFKYRGRWQSINWNEYYDKIEDTAQALRQVGLERGDRVAIMSDSRPEWCFLDMATMALGGAVVPLYQNVSDEDFAFVVNDSQSKILFVESASHVKQWERVKEKCSSVKVVVAIGRKTPTTEPMLSWKEFMIRGMNNPFEHKDEFIERCEAVQLDEIATILYTSGTTGLPKGVVITHTQVSSEIEDTFSLLGVTSRDSCLTFLPYAHVLGRIEIWGQIYKGYSLSFAENMEKIRENLKEIKPTIMVAVPRIFEKIYNNVKAQTENSQVGRLSSQWAFSVGKRVSELRQQKQSISLPVYLEYLTAKKMVFDKITDALGGRLRFAISGGAPLAEDVAKFFHAADILILEGYGLTETTAAVCCNTPWDFRFGSVGKPVGDVEIKIADDGEILVKSKKVMREYLNNEKETQAVFEDGWFKTGDIGEFTEDGFLVIKDRKKDLIKTSGGKYVAPQKLEGLLKQQPLVSNALIHGEKEKYVVALLTLDEESTKKYATDNGLEFVDVEKLSKDKKVYRRIQEVVADVNSQLASYETIKKFAILPHDFTVENGELTPSMKIKRKFCDQKYLKQIQSLY